jgi:cysteine synthase B
MSSIENENLGALSAIGNTPLVEVEPAKGHTIQGLNNMNEGVVPKIYHPDVLDEKTIVSDGEAFETARLIALKEGLSAGMSSGAVVTVALRVAKNMNQGTIIVILPDRGDRYLSTTLFKSM